MGPYAVAAEVRHELLHRSDHLSLIAHVGRADQSGEAHHHIRKHAHEAHRPLRRGLRLATSLRQSFRVEQSNGRAMRAEIEKIVEDIKQSVGLLRRHL